MNIVNVEKPKLNFESLTSRGNTSLIVIHHLGEGANGVYYNRDRSATYIHQEHLNQGWSGIGYHYVIHPDGRIEQGRPTYAVGAHAYGYNSKSIGIVFSGTYMDNVQPTDAQIEACAMLCANLATNYDLPIENQEGIIVGHKDLNATACPGNVYDHLSDIVGKAIWYKQH